MRNLALARETLAGSAADILAVEGGWYITVQHAANPQRRGLGDGTAPRESVLMQPGFFYDFESEAFLVVSLLTVPEVFREGIARLRRAVE